MNKQEAIEKLHDMAFRTLQTVPYDLEFEAVVRVISQIDEPRKVVIPQFVADWIEYCKPRKTLTEALEAGNALANKTDTWIHNNQELFARAWLDGFEVEKEKLYTVEIPDPNVDEYNIVLGRKEGKVQIKQTLSATWRMNCSNQLNESEIRKDFEWAWQFAKEVDNEI